MRGSLVFLSAALLGASACGGGSGENRKGAPSEVTGVILFLETNAAREVTGFTLEEADETFEISIADDVDYGFALSHLNAHVSAADPVRCRVEKRGGRLYALSIEDVPVRAG